MRHLLFYLVTIVAITGCAPPVDLNDSAAPLVLEDKAESDPASEQYVSPEQAVEVAELYLAVEGADWGQFVETTGQTWTYFDIDNTPTLHEVEVVGQEGAAGSIFIYAMTADRVVSAHLVDGDPIAIHLIKSKSDSHQGTLTLRGSSPSNLWIEDGEAPDLPEFGIEAADLWSRPDVALLEQAHQDGYTNYTTAVNVPGSFKAITQQRKDRKVAGSKNVIKCWTGCAPVAGAILLTWWDGLQSEVVQTRTTDADLVEKLISEMGTKCKAPKICTKNNCDYSGSTTPSNATDGINAYLRATVGKKYSRVRHVDAYGDFENEIYTAIDENRPIIAHYFHVKYPDGSYPNGGHAAVISGYRQTTLGLEARLQTGWPTSTLNQLVDDMAIGAMTAVWVDQRKLK